MSLSNADLTALQPVLDATASAIANAKTLRATAPVVWLSADFRSVLAGTGINFRQAGDVAASLVHSVLEQCGPEGSVVVSAFNFDFPRSRCFDVASAPVQTGAFGQQLLSQFAHCRTAHPFYSLLVFGKAQPQLVQVPTSSPLLRHSTGPGSVFEWLINANTELITVGHHYVKSLTAVHHAEHVAGVPFRYTKQFQGVVRRAAGLADVALPTSAEPSGSNDGLAPQPQAQQQTQHFIPQTAAHEAHQRPADEPIDCEFYVRELGVCDFSSLTERGDAAFRHANLLQVLPVTATRRPLLVHSINHNPAHAMMVADLQSTSPAYTDYFGPNRPNIDVITGARADALYLEELKGFIE